jgi:hypothetical protein
MARSNVSCAPALIGDPVADTPVAAPARITHGPHELELTEELQALPSVMRKFSKDVAADG